ncbi:protein FAM186A-like [Sardina pilchardus]|uniref:protein FAM186A-like n=1 Tax=Sardina pilchardus TaxID=27697 RepID=UPI002E11E178
MTASGDEEEEQDVLPLSPPGVVTPLMTSQHSDVRAFAPAANMADQRGVRCPSELDTDAKIRASLDNASVWQEFRGVGTEMLLTREGSHMVPSCRYRLRGLAPSRHYFLLMDFLLVSRSRARGGRSDPREEVGHIYTHPSSPDPREEVGHIYCTHPSSPDPREEVGHIYTHPSSPDPREEVGHIYTHPSSPDPREEVGHIYTHPSSPDPREEVGHVYTHPSSPDPREEVGHIYTHPSSPDPREEVGHVYTHPSSPDPREEVGYIYTHPSSPDPREEVGHIYTHPSSPATGSTWERAPVAFDSLKLTCDRLNDSRVVTLRSDRRYVPRLHVVPFDPGRGRTVDLDHPETWTFVFPQAEFCAVSCYRNLQLISLKIKHNPSEHEEMALGTHLQSPPGVSHEHDPSEHEEMALGTHLQSPPGVSHEHDPSEHEEMALGTYMQSPPGVSHEPSASPSPDVHHVEKKRAKKRPYLTTAPQVGLEASPVLKKKMDPSEPSLSSSVVTGTSSGPEEVTCDVSVSITSKVQEATGATEPEEATEEGPEVQQESIVQLQKALLLDLGSYKHRQVIHPALQQVGLKLHLVGPEVAIDLQYLGVAPYPQSCAVDTPQLLHAPTALPAPATLDLIVPPTPAPKVVLLPVSKVTQRDGVYWQRDGQLFQVFRVQNVTSSITYVQPISQKDITYVQPNGRKVILLPLTTQQAKLTPASGSTLTPSPAPGSTLTPPPAPGSTLTPPPAPGSTLTPSPAPGSALTPSPAAGTLTPSPAPGSSLTPSPAPGSTLTPSPAPGSTLTPSPAAGTLTPSPAPGSALTPSPAPGSTLTPSPAPGSTLTPPPAPGSTLTPSPAPGSTLTPSPAPGPLTGVNVWGALPLMGSLPSGKSKEMIRTKTHSSSNRKRGRPAKQGKGHGLLP